MPIPLTIPQAEALLAAAWGHPVRIIEDAFGHYTRNGDGPYPFYDHYELTDGPHVPMVIPMIGDWPDVDLTDCPVPAENEAEDAAQRWNEQRGA